MDLTEEQILKILETLSIEELAEWKKNLPKSHERRLVCKVYNRKQRIRRKPKRTSFGC